MARCARSLAVGLAAVVAAATPGCRPGESPAASYARDPQAVERGRLLFVGTCGVYCHSLRPGLRDAPDLFDCHWKHGKRDRDIFRVISSGVPETGMLAFAEALPEGEDDVWKLVAFLRVNSRCGN